jgi:hypothetical protein
MEKSRRATKSRRKRVFVLGEFKFPARGFSIKGIDMKEATKTVPVKNIDAYLATVPQKEGSPARDSQGLSRPLPRR